MSKEKALQICLSNATPQEEIRALIKFLEQHGIRVTIDEWYSSFVLNVE